VALEDANRAREELSSRSIGKRHLAKRPAAKRPAPKKIGKRPTAGRRKQA
jgi:hypothetical protein